MQGLAKTVLIKCQGIHNTLHTSSHPLLGMTPQDASNDYSRLTEEDTGRLLPCSQPVSGRAGI